MKIINGLNESSERITDDNIVEGFETENLKEESPLIKLKYITGGIELRDSVTPLWLKLHRHHGANAKHFSHIFRNLTPEDLRKKLPDSSDLQICIDLVKDVEKDLAIAYCITSLTKDLKGEILSLFVEPVYRGDRIGDELMVRSLKWLDAHKAETITLNVAEGNEEVFPFYEKYGFYKRRTTLEQKEKQ